MMEGRIIPDPDSGNELTKEQALAYIDAAKQEIALLGANDAEFSLIDSIEDALSAGTISSKEALRQVQEIKNRKMDYH
jgi:hypothetical protein